MAGVPHPLCRGFGHSWQPPVWTVVLDSKGDVIERLTACMNQCERCTSLRVFYYTVNKDSTLGPRSEGGGYRYVSDYLNHTGERITRFDAVAATFRNPKRRDAPTRRSV